MVYATTSPQYDNSKILPDQKYTHQAKSHLDHLPTDDHCRMDLDMSLLDHLLIKVTLCGLEGNQSSCSDDCCIVNITLLSPFASCSSAATFPLCNIFKQSLCCPTYLPMPQRGRHEVPYCGDILHPNHPMHPAQTAVINCNPLKPPYPHSTTQPSPCPPLRNLQWLSPCRHEQTQHQERSNLS